MFSELFNKRMTVCHVINFETIEDALCNIQYFTIYNFVKFSILWRIVLGGCYTKPYRPPQLCTEIWMVTFYQIYSILFQMLMGLHLNKCERMAFNIPDHAPCGWRIRFYGLFPTVRMLILQMFANITKHCLVTIFTGIHTTRWQTIAQLYQSVLCPFFIC